VTGYESLWTSSISVTRAAIRSAATVIVVANPADFPFGLSLWHGIEALAPDEWLRLSRQDLDAVVEVVERQAADARHSPTSTRLHRFVDDGAIPTMIVLVR